MQDPKWKIRPLRADRKQEIDAIVRMSMQTVLDTVPEFGGEPERAREHFSNFTYAQMREMYERDQNRPQTHRFLVAEDASGKLVGHSIFFKRVPDDEPSWGYLFTRYITPEYRRQGIGSALLQQAMTWFDEQGVAYVMAHTHATNEALQGLLLKHHFQVVERKESPWPTLTLKCTLR